MFWVIIGNIGILSAKSRPLTFSYNSIAACRGKVHVTSETDVAHFPDLYFNYNFFEGNADRNNFMSSFQSSFDFCKIGFYIFWIGTYFCAARNQKW